jgi:cell division protease FtsH
VNANVKAIVFWLVIVLSALLLWQVVKSDGNYQRMPEISYSAFLSQVESGNVTTVTIRKNEVTSICRDSSKCPNGYNAFRVTVPTSQEGMLQTLHQNKVEIVVKDYADGNWPTWLLNLAPLILLAALWFFMIRQIKKAGQKRQAQGQ